MKVGKTIYLDHQATTPLDSRIADAMNPYLIEKFANSHSTDHILGWQSAQAIDESTQNIANLIGCAPDEIFFTSGATESNNMALFGLGLKAIQSQRKRILVSEIEHKCVLESANVLRKRHDFDVQHIPVDNDGFIDIFRLDDMLDDDVLLVSIMAVNNEIGTIQNIEKISEKVQKQGATFHCDATQAPIGMPVGSLALQTDLLSLSGHKIYGPKGIGILYVARELQDRIEPLIYGGGQQNSLRSGTLPVPLCVGIGMACKILSDQDIAGKRRELHHLRDYFVEGLQTLSWPIQLIGPDIRGLSRHPGNASICFQGYSAHEILSSLQPHLAASTGSACTSGIEGPSHVLQAIGLDHDDAMATIRFSLGFDTTDNDVKKAIDLIDQTLLKLTNDGLVRSA